ncbi:MAG: radical SAM protein [Candidatus Latescibacterota bacterium]|nr:MAG: radical SAM protein [Candidatus Latescibacterota bacterium]
MEREGLSLNRYKFFLHQTRCLLPSAGQLLNLFKVGLSYFLSEVSGRSFIWGYPFVLMVEPTNLCNLHCPLCPFASQRNRLPRGKMDVEQLRRVLDQMRGQIKFLLLWNRGEPFMNEDLAEMIREAKKRGIFVQTSTNGHFLSGPQVAEAVVESGLDELIVSVDGITQQSYSRYRKGGDVEKVFRGVETLVKAKRRKGSDTPVITFQFLVMKHNEHEIGDLKRVARRLGADRILLKTVRVGSLRQAEEFLPPRADFSRYTVVHSTNGKSELQLKLKRQSCRRLWYSTVVNWDGEVLPCCFDEKGQYTMGNIFTQQFGVIWRGRRYQKFRSQLLKSRYAFPMCQNCTEGIEKLYISDIWIS